jgi:hypothetical protein
MTTRTKALPVLTLLTALASACTTTPPQPAANLPVFLGTRQVEMQRQYLDRYACGVSTPLYCTCTSRFPSSPCRCGCPMQ